MLGACNKVCRKINKGIATENSVCVVTEKRSGRISV